MTQVNWNGRKFITSTSPVLSIDAARIDAFLKSQAAKPPRPIGRAEWEAWYATTANVAYATAGPSATEEAQRREIEIERGLDGGGLVASSVSFLFTA